MSNYEKQRVNTLLPKNIVDMLDEFAEEMGLSRGNAISVIVKQYFDQQKTIDIMANMEELINQLGIVTENPQK